MWMFEHNYIGCVDPDTAMSDIQILTARIGEAVFNDWGELRSGFAFEPQNECETAVIGLVLALRKRDGLNLREQGFL